MIVQPQQFSSYLAPTPQGTPVFSTEVRRKDESIALVADPQANRALVALMNAHAVFGGAAAHWGGPAALAETMTALHGIMFDTVGREWYEAFNFVNDAGHCENGVYACRANWGFDGMTLRDLCGFRGIESKLSGHGEQHLNPEGVLISNGPLGSALSQAQGLCAGDRLAGRDRITISVLTDGAAMEGEAREALASIPGFALRGNLNPFVLIISDNGTKLSGRIHEDSFSMQPTFESLSVLGWDVIKVEKGNDLQLVYSAIEQAIAKARSTPSRPMAIWMKTVKGYSVKATEEDSGGGHGFPGATGLQMRDFISEIYSGAAHVPAELMEWAQEIETQSLAAKAAKATKAPSKSVKKKIQVGFFPAMDRLVKEGLPVVSVTSDLSGSTGVSPFRKEYPERCYDVGVAEANMIGMAAGLSKAGFLPVVDTFAQFGITKGNLPLIMSALSSSPIVALFSHNGLQDAADGASHQAITSFSAVSAIPMTDVVCCSCAADGEAYLEAALRRIHEARQAGEKGRSVVIFLGREDFPVVYRSGISYEWQKAQLLREPTSDDFVVISAAGYPVAKALAAADLLAAEGIDTAVVQSAIINRPDVDQLAPLVKRAGGRLVTVEDNVIYGGAGAQLAHALSLAGVSLKLRSLGIGDHFGRSAYKADQLYDFNRMDTRHIAQAVQEIL